MPSHLQLNFPGRSHVGPGAVEALGEEAARLGSRALLVTGRTALKKAGITEHLTELLEEAGVEVSLFDRVPPEPDLESVDAAREQLERDACDLVVEAGGGSAIDAGKAAAGLANEPAPTKEYHGGREITRPALPHIAIATTSGTGSEATQNSVITDPDRRLKKSIRGEGLLPDVAVVDAELTLSCPPGVTAGSGMDALVQAIESYFSTHAIPTTEALSLRAVELIAPNLPVAFEDGENAAARAALAEGSHMAGLALGSARLGAVHGMAHPVGLVYDLPHGVVCAILMPQVLEQNMTAATDKYDELRRALGGEPVQVCEALLNELDLPHTPGPYPDPEDEQLILDYALNSGSSAANPTPVDADYVRSVLRGVCRSASSA
jgi:alcohol dehydrogenase